MRDNWGKMERCHPAHHPTLEKIMTMVIPADDEALRQMSDPLLALKATADEMLRNLDSDDEVSREVNKMINLGSAGTYESYRKLHQEIHRLSQEALERAKRVWESIKAQVQSMSAPKMQRAQGRSTRAAKPAAKKHASSSGGGSGGGDGDGDGPARTRSKSKKSRSLNTSKTPTTHPPCSSPGAISTPSPQQSPPPSRSQGMAQLTLLYAINCILIVVLLAMGERELASAALGSGSIPALLNHLKKDTPDKKD